MRLRDVMTRPVECVSPDNTLEEAAQRMRRADVGALPVCEGGRLVGMLTDRDVVVRAVAVGHDPARTPVSEVASRDLVVGREAQHIDEAARLMEGRGIRRLPVLDDEQRLVGIVSVDDLASRPQEMERAGRILAATSQSSGAPVDLDQGESMSRKNTFERERQEPMTRNRYGMMGEGNDDRNFNRDDERYGQRSYRDDELRRVGERGFSGERGFTGERGFNPMSEYGRDRDMGERGEWGGQRGGQQFGGQHFGGHFGGPRGGEWGGQQFGGPRGGEWGGHRGGFQRDYYGQQHGRFESGFQDPSHHGSSQHGMRGWADEDRWYNASDQEGMGRGGSIRQGGHLSGPGAGYGQGGLSRGRGPKGYKRSDERIREDLCDRLSDRHDVDSSEIEVKVHNGEVILSGTVRERYLKHMIEQIAETVSGVQDVRNEIRVKREESESKNVGVSTGTSASTGTADRTQESRTPQEGRRNASS